MTQTERDDINNWLRKVRNARPAGVDEHGMLWVRPTGHGETATELDTAMEAAEVAVGRLGYEPDPEVPIFRNGLAWGQALRRSVA
jgi:hypothetical protein